MADWNKRLAVVLTTDEWRAFGMYASMGLDVYQRWRREQGVETYFDSLDEDEKLGMAELLSSASKGIQHLGRQLGIDWTEADLDDFRDAGT